MSEPRSEKDYCWKVLESRVTYEDRWLKLRTDRCETPSGKILQGFHVIELPDWINVIALDSELNVVLALEYRHGAGRRVMGLPSGILEKSDPSPLEGARRELQEETGYGEGRFFPLGSAAPNPAIQSNRAHSFLAVDLKPGFERHFDPGEDIELIHVPYPEFLRKTLKGELDLQSIHLGAAQLALGFVLRNSVRDSTLVKLKQLALAVLADL
jgi:8-oxo-dGTP pyrophosphatase MutT (NUDIX family)